MLLSLTAPQARMIIDSATHAKLCRLLVENSLGLMCIHDLDGVLLSTNPAVSASLGYPPEAGDGRNLRDFLAPPVRHLFDEYLHRIRRAGKDSGLMRLQAGDGTERVWMYRNTLYSEEGFQPLVLGHALDVTDRVRAEQALKQARAELRKANDELARRVEERTAELQEANGRLRTEIEQRARMEEELLRRRNLESLGLLAGGIAHDFNNFLTVVQGNVALAKMECEQGAYIHNALDEIAGACERAGFLTSQLLTFSKGGSPVRRAVSVAKLVLDAVDLARAGAADGITTEIAPDLWSAEIDAAQIGQVLHNVLLNARQSMPGGGMIEVTASNVSVPESAGAPRPGRYVKITVRDYGCGIPGELLSRVFDPYFTTRPGATGLGLTSAYSIVHKHGGGIAIESQPGRGTVVTIDLPAASGEKLEPAAEAPPVAVPSGPWKLLVMDDEEGIRTLMQGVLSALGHEVTPARDGAEAIARYEAAKAAGRGYDAVLLDLTVKGGMGGIDAAARLREIDPAARLIVSSGYSDSPALSDFRKYGFDDMIPKPWAPEQLLKVFERVLAGRGTREKT